MYFFRIDGGVSRNDFIVQLISNLTGKMIERRTSSEMSAFGIAFLAGLHSGGSSGLFIIILKYEYFYNVLWKHV